MEGPAVKFAIHDAKLTLLEGDITKVPADAIVNAANSGLVGGGGVDGAIHRAGGPAIMKELDEIRRKIGRCPAGEAVVTGAGNLPAKWVIHAVGPIYRDGNHQEAEQLASCYRTSLRLAEENGAKTVSFPSISTGAYGYPMTEAAELAVKTVADYLRGSKSTIETVTFVLFGKAALDEHVRAAKRVLEG